MSKIIDEARKQMGENRRKAEAEKATRRAAKAMEGTRSQRFRKSLVRWVKRAFYTAFLVLFAYVTIMAATMMVPLAMATVLSSLGYTLANLAELLLAGLSGIFFVLWAFVLTFLAIRKAWKVYLGAIEKTK